MTTLFPQSVRCVLCDTENEVLRVGSTNAFGSMDLDLRPPPMQRNIMHTEVQRCGYCGFCSADIANGDGLAVDRVGSPNYIALLNDLSFPPLARDFRAHAHLAGEAGEWLVAVRAQLNAAWACDDARTYPGAAERCRRETLRLLDRLHQQAQTFCEDSSADQILRLDLLRRSGQFVAVSKLAATLLSANLPDFLARIATFQDERAKANDQACYKVEAAVAI